MTEDDIRRILEYIENRVRALGYEPYDVYIRSHGGHTVVKVVIDRNDRFIGIVDCSYVSRNIESYLEEAIPGRFFLEVSSPGADRELKRDSDFERFKGMYVEVIYKSGKRVIGKLMGKVEDKLYIMPKVSGRGEQKIVDIPFHEISKVKLHPTA